MSNLQYPEKVIGGDFTETLDVVSIFPTIQGEGPFAGEPAIFIRLAGCNLQCPFCDTDYTTDRKMFSIQAILDKLDGILSSPNRIATELVVITGGEPFRQVIGNLVNVLLAEGFRVQIETNGTLYRDLPYEDPKLTIVCSPKTGNLAPLLMPHIKALKYVVTAGQIGEDGLPERALGHPSHPRVARPWDGYSGKIYVQPADHHHFQQNEANRSAALRSCFEFGYTLCLQIHKIIDIE